METLKHKGYEMPKAEIIIFDTEDVITTSGIVSGDDNESPFMPV